MEKQEAIDLINTLFVVSADAEDGFLLYANVKNDEKTREVLKKLNADRLAGVNGTYAECYKSELGKDEIDISPLAFEYAQWFDGNEFLLQQP